MEPTSYDLIVIGSGPAGESGAEEVSEELKRQPADVILFLDEADDARRARKVEIGNVIACLDWSGAAKTKVVGISFSAGKAKPTRSREKEDANQGLADRLGEALKDDDKPPEVVAFDAVENFPEQARLLMSILTRELPNEARIEMTRISGDRDSQREIARQIPRLGQQQIIAEPVGRNTAPAIGLVAFILFQSDPDAVIGVSARRASGRSPRAAPRRRPRADRRGPFGPSGD